MPRSVLALLLLLLAAGCTAAQVARTARATCRASPSVCADPEAPPASRAPGL
jgi:hypothetical protein